jgi:peptidoglycan hydrolase CwlO-like protein
MKNKLNLVVALLFTTIFSFAQTSNKSFTWNKKPSSDSVVMTWNKNTPEQEMKDDIKALAEHGVTIKYSNVKRNDKNEITAIDVSFEDKNGNKGSLSYKNNKPISTIKFFKQDDEVGFGNPSNSFGDIMAFNDFGNGEAFKQFNFNFNNDSIPSLDFSMPGKKSITTKKRSIYKKEGKKPLVIENGDVIEGGDDYTPEELEKIKEEFSTNEDDEISIFSDFNFNNQNDLQKQMEKMQEQINKLLEKNGLSDNKELEQSKKELEKAKKELQETKKEIEKTKSSLKTKKV